ncbi:MAG TPA: DUF6691 family protein [Balneolales bacterium]|nr:DUF6691 family protein [Balneolales bacterium]
MKGNLKYLFAGIAFGFILIKSEVVSWFRIQEMFRFQSIFMYGIIGLAVIIGFLSIQIIKRLKLKDIEGTPITIPPKDNSQYTRYIIGGIIFGLGWAMLGACPGPLFALLGAGYTVMIIPIISAVFGTWMYGKMRSRLPH